MSTHVLIIAILILWCISAFFSAAEIAMMAINRYRVKHAAKTDPKASLVLTLLSHTDHLLATILIGNNFANIASGSIATVVGIRLYGDLGAVIATFLTTCGVLLLAEIVPKILASQKPEFVAYATVRPLNLFMKILFPVVWVTNILARAMLRLMNVKESKKGLDILTMDELRTVVNEAGSSIPSRHRSMLSSILDLEFITVDDIMTPKGDITGLNIADSEEQILHNIREAKHTLLPIYNQEIDEIYGIVHLRDLSRSLTEHQFTKALLLSLAEKPYFVPEGTPLHTQLFNFQRNKQRFGLVVDEYGAVLGLVTLADILEEIVGEFTTDINSNLKIIPQPDNSYLVDGGVNIRTLNQTMQWDLPTDEAKTLSGAIIAHLEMIPTPHTCVLLNGYPIEIIAVQDNTIKTCKISPRAEPDL